MEKRQARLVEVVQQTRNDCRFEDLTRMLQAFGYVARETGSSHVAFRRPGSLPLSIPKRKPIERHYVDEALATILALEGE